MEAHVKSVKVHENPQQNHRRSMGDPSETTRDPWQPMGGQWTTMGSHGPPMGVKRQSVDVHESPTGEPRETDERSRETRATVQGRPSFPMLLA